jgi:hypothetical protein
MTAIVTFNQIGWRSTIANFDKVALAIESGDDIIDGEDVIRTLRDEVRPQFVDQDEIVHHNVDDIATRLISNAVDTVYSVHDIGGIDLVRNIPELGEDDYQPPQWDANEMLLEGEEMLEKFVHKTLEELTPEAPSVLSVHENEQHLITRPNRIEEQDYGRAADILTELDNKIDSKIKDAELDVFNNSILLSDLEEKMIELSQKAGSADIDELIAIADELRHLEEKLVAIDPTRDELPPFEEDDKPRRIAKRRKGKSKRKVTRRTPKTVVTKNTDSYEASLDSFEPEGEWNIQAEDIDMIDLLDDSTIENKEVKQPVKEEIVRVIKTPKSINENYIDKLPELLPPFAFQSSGEEE